MIDLVWLVVVVAVLTALWVAADRSRTIAVVQLGPGRARVTRGRLAAGPLREVDDVVTRMKLGGGKMVLRRDGERAAVSVDSRIDARAAQQLRNVIGRFHARQLR